MTGSAVDYAGRQLDVELLQHISEPVDQRVFPEIDRGEGIGPSIVAGMQKVVQRYAKLLLTDLGSVKFDTSVGGELLTSIRAGKIQSNGYLEFIFSLANRNALQKMIHDDNLMDVYGRAPDDERISNAILVDYDIIPEKATIRIHVRIETVAGTDYVYVIPVPVGIS